MNATRKDSRASPAVAPKPDVVKPEKDQNTVPKMYKLTIRGVEEEFNCDLSLEDAFNTVRNDTEPKNEFTQSILEAYEKSSGNLSPAREAWLFKLALEIKEKGLRNKQGGAEESPLEYSEDGAILNTFQINVRGHPRMFKTALTIQEAVELILKDDKKVIEFRDDLVKQYLEGVNLSEKQLAWIAFYGHQREKEEAKIRNVPAEDKKEVVSLFQELFQEGDTESHTEWDRTATEEGEDIKEGNFDAHKIDIDERDEIDETN